MMYGVACPVDILENMFPVFLGYAYAVIPDLDDCVSGIMVQAEFHSAVRF